jgi:hypothetical protein
MSKIRLTGSTSGYTEITAPSAAGSNTLILPTGNGTADQVLSGNGSGTLSFVDRGRMVLETSKSATGTSVEFTDIPSWVKRIQVIHAAISTNGTNPYFIQLGSTTYSTSGYASSANIQTYSTGLVFANNLSAATLVTGISTLLLVGSNLWVHASVAGANSGNSPTPAHGSITLGGTLDRLRLISSATGSPSSTWDAGDFNILYEG